MKTKNLFFAVLFALPFTAMAGSVPDAVKKAFAKKYPAVAETSVQWEAEGKNFEADFKTSEGKTFSATFSAEGKLLETKEEIAVTALPATITDHVAKSCATPLIFKAEVVKDASGNIKLYKIDACDQKDWTFDAASGHSIR